MATKPFAMGLVLCSTIFTAGGQILFKMASADLSLDLLAQLTNYHLITGFVAYGIGAVMLVVSLKHGELSVLYPIYALNFIWVSILSPYFFESDYMNAVKWFGVIAIVIGVSLIGMGSRNES